MLTLLKNYSDESRTQKRINVKKIVSLHDVINKPIKNITLYFRNLKDIYKIQNLDKKNGETDVKILFQKDNEVISFILKEKRFINNKLLNSLNLVNNLIND